MISNEQVYENKNNDSKQISLLSNESNGADISDEENFAYFEDVISLDEAKNALRLFNNNHDTIVKQLIIAAIKTIEQIINSKIIAEEVTFLAKKIDTQTFHTRIILPYHDILKIKKIKHNNLIINDFELINDIGKSYLNIPFARITQRDRVFVTLIRGMLKNKIPENIKVAATILVKDLFEDKFIKSDTNSTIKFLLAQYINYNI